MKNKILIITVIISALLLSGCAGIKKTNAELEPSVSAITPTPAASATPSPSVTPTPTPELKPTPEPTPERSPGQYGDGLFVIEQYNNEMPQEITTNFKYTKYVWFLNYVVLKEDTHVYEDRIIDSEWIRDYAYGSRIETTAKLSGLDNGYEQVTDWYRVHYQDKWEQEQFGYVNAALVSHRTFDIKRGYNETVNLSKLINDDETLYVPIQNRGNDVGMAPDSGLKNSFNKVVDEFGVLQDQSAPAYFEKSKDSNFRYIPDGTMVEVIKHESDDDALAEIYIPQYDENFYMPRKFLRYFNNERASFIDKMTQCIVIDRRNQNTMYFEVNEETAQWELLSMSFISTGHESEHADPTPLGYFAVLKVRPQFEYPSDVTGQIAGYAPYVMRFSGGAYAHGVPVNHTLKDDGTLKKGSMKESHGSLGVKPESHMCVRNYTSHAEFLYNRVKTGDAAVIVIE